MDFADNQLVRHAQQLFYINFLLLLQRIRQRILNGLAPHAPNWFCVQSLMSFLVYPKKLYHGFLSKFATVDFGYHSIRFLIIRPLHFPFACRLHARF